MEKLKQVEAQAKELIQQHVPDFKFAWMNKKKTYGTCNYTLQTISISKHLALHGSDEAIKDVILHEIAHALVGRGHRHDYVWKRACREIGAKPQRGSNETILTGGHKYELRCEPCNIIQPVYRKPKNPRYVCGRCKSKIVLQEV